MEQNECQMRKVVGREAAVVRWCAQGISRATWAARAFESRERMVAIIKKGKKRMRRVEGTWKRIPLPEAVYVPVCPGYRDCLSSAASGEREGARFESVLNDAQEGNPIPSHPSCLPCDPSPSKVPHPTNHFKELCGALHKGKGPRQGTRAIPAVGQRHPRGTFHHNSLSP